MKTRYPGGILVFLALAFLGGCATVDNRIAERPEVFANLTPKQQDNIREGLIDLGYSPDMVWLALGNPDRQGVRVTDDGRAETWTYEGVRLADVDYYPQFGGYYAGYYWGGRSVYLRRFGAGFHPTVRETFDKIIVEFRDNRVVGIEFPHGDVRLPKEDEPVKESVIQTAQAD